MNKMSRQCMSPVVTSTAASVMSGGEEEASSFMELLACPASSVLSERAFSAAGGFVTDHRARLSTDSVDRLTFIKMNQSWISRYDAPDANAGD